MTWDSPTAFTGQHGNGAGASRIPRPRNGAPAANGSPRANGTTVPNGTGIPNGNGVLPNGNGAVPNGNAAPPTGCRDDNGVGGNLGPLFRAFLELLLTLLVWMVKLALLGTLLLL